MIKILPSGATTVAALLRGEVSRVPGNHVSGAEHKLALTKNGANAAIRRGRDFLCLFR